MGRRMHKTLDNTSHISVTPTDSTVFTSSTAESSTTSLESGAPSTVTTQSPRFPLVSKSSSPVSTSDKLPGKSSHAPSPSFTAGSDGAVPHSINKSNHAFSSTLATSDTSSKEWISNQVSSSLSEVASRASPTTTELQVEAETVPSTSINTSFVSKASLDIPSSSASGSRPPIHTPDAALASWNGTSSNLSPATIVEAQQHKSQSMSLSPMRSATEIWQIYVPTSTPSFPAHPTPVLSSQLDQYSIITTEASSVAPTFTATTPTAFSSSSVPVYAADVSLTMSRIQPSSVDESSTASPSSTPISRSTSSTISSMPSSDSGDTGLHPHSVSTLSNWSSSSPSTVGASSSSSTSSSGSVTSATSITPTSMIPQKTASGSSSVPEDLLVSKGSVLNGTSEATISPTVSSEMSVGKLASMSGGFVWPQSQSLVLSSSVLSVRPTGSVFPSPSVLPSTGEYWGIVPTISRIASTPLETQTDAIPTVTRPTDSMVTGSVGVLLPNGPTAALPGNGTVSSSGIFSTSTLVTESNLSFTGSGSASSTIEPSSQTSYTFDNSMQTSQVSTISQTPIASSVQTTGTSSLQMELSSIFFVQPITPSGIDVTSSAAFIPFPTTSTTPTGLGPTSTSGTTEDPTSSTGTVFPTRDSSSRTSTADRSQLISTSSAGFSTVRPSPTSFISAISSFVTKTKTRNSENPSQTRSASNDISETPTRRESTTLLPTSNPTETVAAATPRPLTPSETAGVALGSTAGVLLAIVAAIFVARRYHAMHAAKRASGASSSAYPRVPYLYDPSLGNRESGGGGDEEASAFMSGGAGGLPPPSTGSRTPPRAPNNSLDHGYRQRFSISGLHYSDPGNPFSDSDDPWMDWRSSDAIHTPSDTASALAAAVAGYCNGPQRPLPPTPNRPSTQAFHDHIIPSPTLSPLMNGCSLRRSPALSSRRNSVKSQRSLRKLHSCPSPNSAAKDYPPRSPYGRGPRQSLSSIKEAESKESLPDPIEHDLLLPVDIRTETPDSVMVYTPAPVFRTMRPPLPNTFSKDQSTRKSPLTIAIQEKALRSTDSILFPTHKDPPPYSYTPLVQRGPSPPSPLSSSPSSSSSQTITQITYNDFPTPPTNAPRHKGWDDIKRRSDGSSSLMSPLSATATAAPPIFPGHHFEPPVPRRNLTPPPPLKKRSLIQLKRKTPLAGTGQPMAMATTAQKAPFSPLRVNTKFAAYDKRNYWGFERGGRKSR
ncbi:hypothetical protein TW65_03402 [Stemphylium lycopersici]|nr:hypothetical protein TW65_03402 [Stemphylium lycopersici]